MGWRSQWHREWPSVWSELETEWHLMLRDASAPSPFHIPDFVRAWCQTIGSQGVDPLFGFFRHQSGARVLLPWVVVRYHGRFVQRRVVEYAGGSLAGYQSPLVASSNSGSVDWNELWQEAQLATEGYCDQGLMRYVQSEIAPTWARPMPDRTPVLSLTDGSSLEDLLSRCSQNHRGDVRRRVRRLHEMGELELWTPSSASYDEVVSDLQNGFLPQHSILCHQKGYADPFDVPESLPFLETLFRVGLRDGWAFYGALRVGGKSVAWILGLLHHDEFYWWRPAYHSEWGRFSPGKVLLALTLEHAISLRWKKVHFLAGGQRYKLAWKPDLPSTSSVSWYPPGVRSSTFSWYDRLAGTR